MSIRELFNEEQNDHLDELDRIPPAERCWCGWYCAGECPHCPPSKTLADRNAAACPRCGNAPPPDGSRLIVHIIGCTNETEAEREHYRATMRGQLGTAGERF